MGNGQNGQNGQNEQNGLNGQTGQNGQRGHKFKIKSCEKWAMDRMDRVKGHEDTVK